MPVADFVIRNAQLIDGTGAPGVAADIAITDERISAIGPTLNVSAEEDIDALGLALAPGFIDAHTHDDRVVLSDPGMACKISQGVTTVVTGNCGISIAPVRFTGHPPAPIDLIGHAPENFFATFSDYFAALDAAPPAVNVVAQVGHTSLRAMAMDRFDRPATQPEIDAMRRALHQALEDGAAGLSTGLAYRPAHAAPTEEIEALAAVAAEFSGFHSTHMRDEGAGVLTSLAETFRIGQTARIPVIISHHKCAGIPNHGQSCNTLPAIETAMAQQPVALDCYPYVASSTVLDPVRVAEATKTVIAWSTKHPEHAGKDLTDIAQELGQTVEQTTDMLQPAGAIYFNMHEDDVRRILSFSATMIGSDGLPHDEFPHPRLWGTFPRVLGHYARDIGLFPIEEAVRKMTSLTARAFGIKDRGIVAEGHFADLVLFDADTITDSATFEAPSTPAAGISQVFVNGKRVWQHGSATGLRSGKGLRRQDLAALEFTA